MKSIDLDRCKLALSSLIGLSIADAFGEKFFHDPKTVEQRIAKRIFPNTPWWWTDDTAMATAITETLLKYGYIKSDILAESFAYYYAKDPERGYGPGAFNLLRSLCLGVPWQEASSKAFEGEGSFGNGAAMRSAPV